MIRHLALALLFCPAAAFAQVERMTDINSAHTGPAAFVSFVGFELYLHEVVAFGTRVAFTADDGIHGVEPWVTDGTAAGTRMVADLCPGRCPSYPRALAVFEDQLFFTADDGVHGSEPFLSDGTAAGTVQLGDLWPGHGTSRIRSALASSTQVFFVADSPGRGWELWRTDGTVEGTRLVRDVQPGPEASRAYLLGTVGGAALFSATDGTFGIDLWRSDGTAAGTAIVPGGPADLASSSNDSAVASPTAVFFLASTAALGQELWRSDGTEVGTFPVTKTANPSMRPYSLTFWNSRVYFLQDLGFESTELWVSDGTVAGTSRVATLPADLWSQDLIAGSNGIYFQGCDTGHGCELWFSDGTEGGTRRVQDLRGAEDGLAVYRPLLAAVQGGLLYYADDGAHGSEPWFSDGTEAGTRLVADLTPGPPSSQAEFDAWRGLTRASVAGRAFFWASTPHFGFELWSSDGTAARTELTADVHAVASSLVRPPPDSYFTAVPPVSISGGLVLFATDHGIDSSQTAPGTTGREPWFVPHAGGAPTALGDLAPGPAWLQAQELLSVPGGAVFRRGEELWRTDGTVAETGPVTATLGLEVDALERMNSQLLLVERTDSSPSAHHLRPLSLDLGTLGPRLFSETGDLIANAAGDRAFFTSDTRLAVTDGTPGGTRVISEDFSRGYATNFEPVSADLTLFFGSTEAEGFEPWSFRSSDSAPVLVLDIWPGTDLGLFPGMPRWESSQLPPFAPLGGTVLFGADDGVHGFELWASDGTAPGTRMVVDLRPGATPSDLERITAVGSRAFLVADDGVHGRELWVSDGTALGTRLVHDLAPGLGSAVPQELTALGDFLVFNAWTPDAGRELWISDGTAIGTRRLTDIAPGAASSSPVAFVAAGGWLYFTANDNLTGDELWRLPLALVQGGTIFADGFGSGDLQAWSSSSP